MKRHLTALFIPALLLLAGSLVAQSITIDHVSGMLGSKLIVDGNTPIRFWLRYQNPEAYNFNISNGFRVYSPDGKIWSGPIKGDTATPNPLPRSNWDLNFAMNAFAGAQEDTLGIIAAKISSPGLPPNFNGVPYAINIGPIKKPDTNKTVCIDSAWFRPGGTWKWAASGGVNRFPSWDGPHCYQTAGWVCPSPFWLNFPVSITTSHCHQVQFTFSADVYCGQPVYYSVVSGPGSIDANTGIWTYTPDLSDAGASIVLVVRATASGTGTYTDGSVNIIVTNEAPVITCPTQLKLVPFGSCKDQTVTATDACNDPIHFTLESVVPNDPGVTATIDPNSGVLHFCASSSAIGDFSVKVWASDTKDSVSCEVPYAILDHCPFVLQISKEHNVLQGQYRTVPVSLNTADVVQGLGGFDILIGYDASALSFQDATIGDAFGPSGCGWEYFTYRFNPNGNCGTNCPTGLIKVVGLAETNNGPNHPACDLPSTLPAVLFNLNFLVSNNRTLNCQFVPIRFYWMDCNDNVFSNTAGDQLYVSCSVAEYENPLVNIQDRSVGFPTYLGAQAECLVGLQGKPAPISDIDFINGGIDIVCSDSIDSRGDLNLNGVAYEVADAVMFTKYFLVGLPAFMPYPEPAIAASDVNADGIPLTVADLVYLIRVIVGDAQPFLKLTPIEVNYTFNDGILNVPQKMGAFYVVFAGNVTPTNLTNMEMATNFDGVNTRCLLYPNFNHVATLETAKGEIVACNAPIVSIEMATALGSPVIATRIPTSYSLAQNYPNPFNPETRIEFELPLNSHVSLVVYDLLGRQVRSLSEGDLTAGSHSIVWDGRDDSGSQVASGVYLYRLTAGSTQLTRKMLLLK